MTNYNERLNLDEVLERYRLFANMAYSEVEDGFRTADEFKDLALPKVLDEAKQAITSLIKQLVAEAKPYNEQGEIDIDNPAYNDGYYSGAYSAIEKFEQNLLKALEEV